VTLLKSVRVGVVGTGNIARIAHLPSLFSVSAAKVTALCDVDKSNLLKTTDMYHVESTYSDHKDMLDNEDLDCVFCLSSLGTHTEIVMDCLQGGVDVFCEKPLAMTVKELKKIIRASEKSGRWVQVGYNRLFAPVYQKARSVFQTRQARLCLAKKCFELRTPPPKFLENNLIHAISILNWFCGRATSIRTEVCKVGPERLRTLSALIRYKRGVIGVLIGDYSGGGYAETLEVHGNGCTAFVNAPHRATISLSGKQEIYEPGATYHYPWHKLFGYQQEDESFIECVRRNAKPWPSLKEDLDILNIIGRIRETLS
jgi:virulence factor